MDRPVLRVVDLIVPGRGFVMVLVGLWALGALAARGDVVHLRSGGTLEGRIEAEDDQRVTLRTRVGIIKIARQDIERIERGPSILDEYERRRAQVRDEPQALYELALWCKANGFAAEAREHLRRAIALDPDFEPARTALGYVRVGRYWVRADRRTRPSRSATARRGTTAAQNHSSLDVVNLRARLTQQIRAIRTTMLDTGSPRLIRQGREKIRRIDNPAAILPLASVLSKGSVAARLALVEALSRFKEDEATLNLAVLALSDDDPDVRHKALVELKRRGDPRVGEQFRRALRSNNDVLIRRAAYALGKLRYAPAIPDLIRLLRARGRGFVEIPVNLYWSSFTRTFSGISQVLVAKGTVVVVPTIGVATSGTVLQAQPVYQERDLTVYRTEVLEALKQITGQNFGFDVRAWQQWYEEHQP